MFKNKLKSLQYFNCENFNFEDETEFRSLMCWLEDQKIRKYKIHDRNELRNMKSKQWNNIFKKYLQDVGCPFNENEKNDLVDWLIGYAVSIEYKNNMTKYKQESKDESNGTDVKSNSNPLNTLDFESPDFKAGVTSLAQLLQIPKHPNHLITLEAVCKIVNQKLSAEAMKETPAAPNDVKKFPLRESSLSFDAGDYVVNEATKVLRLLYVKDLRELQTKINEIIVAVQTITANPKTDSRLGKVGR